VQRVFPENVVFYVEFNGLKNSPLEILFENLLTGGWSDFIFLFMEVFALEMVDDVFFAGVLAEQFENAGFFPIFVCLFLNYLVK